MDSIENINENNFNPQENHKVKAMSTNKGASIGKSPSTNRTLYTTKGHEIL